MEGQNRIALFVDIDNMPLTKEHIDNIVSKLKQDGVIAYAKIYGVTDRRHREIICDAVSNGFEIAPPVYPNRRGSTKVFDHRILVDLCELVFTNPTIDAVAIVANPTNLVYLFSKLKKENIFIYGCDNLDDDSLAFVDCVLNFGYDDPNTAIKLKRAEEAKLPQPKKPQPVKEIAAENADVSDESDDDMDVLRQIRQLKNQQPSGDDKEDAELIDKIKQLLDEFN